MNAIVLEPHRGGVVFLKAHLPMGHNIKDPQMIHRIQVGMINHKFIGLLNHTKIPNIVAANPKLSSKDFGSWQLHEIVLLVWVKN